ncbi:phospholipase B1, membrane-associated-like [Haliotis asinina]|uniref:phospholipase B1, membrane-associated-like n=1 Tax=Haliotis asinina TaxID=109174 RepID=UPI003531A271
MTLTSSLQVLWLLAVYVTMPACHGSYDDYRAWLSKAAYNVTIQRDFRKHLRLFNGDLQDEGHFDSGAFPCTTYPASRRTPVSVHRLRPGDIKVVAAMGDSITAGNGITAKTIMDMRRQDRGLSWSIGGDRDYAYQPTIPNILKKYNPFLRGFAVKSGSVWSREAHLDVAEPGAESASLTKQAELLIKRMKNELFVDFRNDWKLITIFIGGDDLCSYCKDLEHYNASNYVQNVQQALDILHSNIPRAFVNLVSVNHVDVMQGMNLGSICSILHQLFCSCGSYPRNEQDARLLHQAADDYNDGLEKLVASGRYDDRDDFTVVVQPFFRYATLPMKGNKPDLSYFSPDCFHFSQRGQAVAARALWNNMIQPVGTKRTTIVPGETLQCPSELNPYFFTRKNSANYQSVNDQRPDAGGYTFTLRISIG